MMQEVKAIGFMLESNLNFIWKDAIKLFTKHDRGRGGIALLINPKWENYISENGCSPCQRAVWCTFQHDDNIFGICSIYALNDPKERSNLWDWLISLPDTPWLCGGDFNMIESQDDKAEGNPFHWKDIEKFHWNRFLDSKNLFDPIVGNRNLNPGIWHTWCNFQ